MKKFGDRLRYAMEMRGVSQAQLGEAVGIAQQSVGSMLARSDPSKSAVQIAKYLRIRPEWLALGEGPMDGQRELSSARPDLEEAQARYQTDPEAAARNLVMIPRFDVQASAGPGMFADQELIIDYVAFQSTWIWQTLNADPKDLALITATGDSMEMTIRSGDLLLVNTAVTEFKDDAIYVIDINNALQVKRIQRFLSGGIAVKSDNPVYEEQRLTDDEADYLRVAGRVCWIARMV